MALSPSPTQVLLLHSNTCKNVWHSAECQYSSAEAMHVTQQTNMIIRLTAPMMTVFLSGLNPMLLTVDIRVDDILAPFPHAAP